MAIASDVVIVSACRTPIGKIRGSLATLRPDDLLALVFKESMRRSQIPLSDVGEVFAGCANQAGEDNRNVARMSSLLAEFHQHIPAVTVNRLCASGLEAIIQAARAISLGDYQVAVAGGVESMSRAPLVLAKPASAFASGVPAIFDSSLGWRFPNPALEALFPLESMGETGENVAQEFGISRAEQDNYALASHQKAVKAQKSGFFKDEILEVSVPQSKGAAIVISQDDGPRANTSLAQLSSLKPVFRQPGTVTAGNSSSMNDGAAALVLASREYAHAHGLPVLGVLRSWASVGVDPRFMGIGPVPATQKALAKIKAQAKDLDLIELNEAFASQSLAVIRQLGLAEDKVNRQGGAIALGHPLGCSGARIVTTLLSGMKAHQAQLGLASLCVGVGQGLSLIVERESD